MSRKLLALLPVLLVLALVALRVAGMAAAVLAFALAVAYALTGPTTVAIGWALVVATLYVVLS